MFNIFFQRKIKNKNFQKKKKRKKKKKLEKNKFFFKKNCKFRTIWFGFELKIDILQIYKNFFFKIF